MPRLDVAIGETCVGEMYYIISPSHDSGTTKSVFTNETIDANNNTVAPPRYFTAKCILHFLM